MEHDTRSPSADHGIQTRMRILQWRQGEEHTPMPGMHAQTGFPYKSQVVPNDIAFTALTSP